jgi:dienelactone hydrolase
MPFPVPYRSCCRLHLALLFAATTLWTVATASAAFTKIDTKTINYSQGGVALKGYLAAPQDASPEHKRPGVLVIHEWWGLNDYIKGRTEQLAKLGYVAMAADMYGDGKHSNDVEKAKAWSGQFYGKPLMAQRARAGLDVLAADPRVDPNRLVVIGYCFGGTSAIELAYSGAPVKGAVAFHGTPPPPTDAQAKTLKARLLLMVGVKDPMFPRQAREKLIDGLNRTDAHWEMIYYSHAVHAFTNPKADEHHMDGVSYDKQADEQSWLQLQSFLKQVFGQHDQD